MRNFLYIILVLLAVGGCKKDSTLFYNEPAPIASFTYQLGNGAAVSFTSTSENADSYSWEFGDGNTSTEKNPTHVYSQPGTYSVKLTVENRNKVNVTVEKEITVTSKPITSVTITSIALVSHKARYWDNGNGEGIAADLAVQVVENGSVILSSLSSPVMDVPATQKTTWNLNTPFKITDFTRSFDFVFLDVDVSGYESVAEVTFKPLNHTVFDGTNQPYADEIILYDMDPFLGATVSVSVTWD